MNGWHAGHRPGIICQVCRGMRNLVRLFAYLCHPVLHNNQKIVSNFLKDKTLLSNCGCLSLGCSLCPWKLHRVTLCLSRNCYFSFVLMLPFLQEWNLFRLKCLYKNSTYVTRVMLFQEGIEKEILCRIAAENNFCSLHIALSLLLHYGSRTECKWEKWTNPRYTFCGI